MLTAKAARTALSLLARPHTRLSSTYPFSSAAIIPPAPPEPAGALPAGLRQGKGLMAYLQRTLPTPEKQRVLASLFARNHPERVRPGSVLTVTLAHAPHVFSGVLMGVRRRGPDTSFTLRNVVARTGVEMQFFVTSPHVKDIKVVMRATGKGPDKSRRTHKAKMNYLREYPQKMAALVQGIKV